MPYSVGTGTAPPAENDDDVDVHFVFNAERGKSIREMLTFPTNDPELAKEIEAHAAAWKKDSEIIRTKHWRASRIQKATAA